MHTIALARALALYHKILYFGLKPQPNTFVFNPATHESARIPDAPTHGFDHAILAYGFGCAPSIDDYKLVKAVNAPLVVVFLLKTSAWKLVEGFHYEKPTEVWEGPLSCGTHLNGTLHWVFKLCGGGECVIAAFDLETDTFREKPVPTISVSGFSTGFLKGWLCLMDRVFGLRRGDIGEIEQVERKKEADVFQCLREILIWL